MLTRRRVLQGSLTAAGALLLARPSVALGSLPTPFEATPLTGSGASRRSRLFRGLACAHADLHNHSHLSDGAGDPTFAFTSMRDAGLDVAALTDHATVSWGPTGAVTEAACSAYDGEPRHGEALGCRGLAGIDEARWRLTGALADAADTPGAFVAMRGFEWSSPLLGHVNVWFSERWIDPLHTGGVDASGLGEHFREGGAPGEAIGSLLDGVGRGLPLRTGMVPFYEWLRADPGTPGLGGGADGLACFNHPGREAGRFSYFRYHRRVAEQMAAMEILNRDEDYLFRSFADGQPSPLVECLDAGWRVGLIGVTDEHGTDWGHYEGKGRAGLWVRSLTREGVREAIAQRRVFATFERGLRLDAGARPAPAGGRPAWGGQAGAGWRQMGRELEHRRGRVQFALDLDGGPSWQHRLVEIQVLRPGSHVPAVIHVERARVPSTEEPPITFTVDLDRDDGDWVVLRIADPSSPNPQPGPHGHGAQGKAIAYTSPWWLPG